MASKADGYYALAHTKPGTTLTFYLNQFYAGGHIWSLVLTPKENDGSGQWANQPPLRFVTIGEAEAFIAEHLAGNELVRVVEVAR